MKLDLLTKDFGWVRVEDVASGDFKGVEINPLDDNQEVTEDGEFEVISLAGHSLSDDSEQLKDASFVNWLIWDSLEGEEDF